MKTDGDRGEGRPISSTKRRAKYKDPTRQVPVRHMLTQRRIGPGGIDSRKGTMLSARDCAAFLQRIVEASSPAIKCKPASEWGPRSSWRAFVGRRRALDGAIDQV